MRQLRLQKFIADCGITSRRKAEDLISRGQVKVNGEVIRELGSKVFPAIDAVEVDGEMADLKSVKKIYLLMNKPRSVMTTMNDPEGRKTVLDFCMEISERIYPVGRLDYLSEGLLLLTNDGDIANSIIHPKSNVVKVYEIKVFGAINQFLLKNLRAGASLDGIKTKPISVRIIKQLKTKTWLEFRISEGKNREIRKICETYGVVVDKLKRVAIGGLTVEGIAPGGYRLMSKRNLLGAIGINEDGKIEESAVEYFSSRKTVSLKIKGVQFGTAADDKAFDKFKKDQYFSSLTKIKESKELKLKKEREEAYNIHEKAHRDRKNKKKFREKKKLNEKKNLHVEL